ncbi:hypothetical protein JB92DRAFT_2965165 [Gautieria morchelliformis]|nr:hypothetical protein JB92DRAFT_2965165 [Gautieria morchelliformis]
MERPKWTRCFMWSPQAASCTPSAGSTEVTEPFNSCAPGSVLCGANYPRQPFTIQSHRTPIHVSHFEFFLSSHPFVASVQFANVGESAPITFDFSNRDIYEAGLDFLREQRVFEVAACGRYSPALGCDLLPDMYSTPVGVVPNTPVGQISPYQRPQRGTSRAPTLGPRDGSRVRFGNLHDFWTEPAQRSQAPQARSCLDDVSGAYRCWPVHPDHAGTSSESPVRLLASTAFGTV